MREAGAQDSDGALRIRDLEETVRAMRDALELRDREAGEQKQAALAATAAETDELKTTIVALRDQLEADHEAHRSAMQEVERLHRDERRELEATVQALRDQLEKAPR